MRKLAEIEYSGTVDEHQNVNITCNELENSLVDNLLITTAAGTVWDVNLGIYGDAGKFFYSRVGANLVLPVNKSIPSNQSYIYTMTLSAVRGVNQNTSVTVSVNYTPIYQ